MAIISGWGNYPRHNTQILNSDDKKNFTEHLQKEGNKIPIGNLRSYGDSALANQSLNLKEHNHFLSFDNESGLLHLQAGALIDDILKTFVPRGWFVKVTPGTKLITIGGAIASDVHGKNHHISGCFSSCVHEIEMQLPTGENIICSHTRNEELFYATCGGQGLTGIILSAKIFLKKIKSQYIEQTTIKTSNLKETFQKFEEFKDSPYSVAWIDCLAKGENLGRCLLMIGDFAEDNDLNYKPKQKFSIPFNFPSFALNKFSVSIFNILYYNKVTKKTSKQKVGIDSFFYPLDSIGSWNRIYGKNGFIQYQFILPLNSSLEGLEEILKVIADSGKGSFLAVLKLYGKENKNWLSFPIEGYSLALDFKIEKGLFELLEQLDQIVLKYKGRFYLSKDARVSKEVFEQGYPNIEKFRNFRKQNKMNITFNSLQSNRLEL